MFLIVLLPFPLYKGIQYRWFFVLKLSLLRISVFLRHLSDIFTCFIVKKKTKLFLKSKIISFILISFFCHVMVLSWSICIHTLNSGKSVLMRRMKLEPIIQSEVSQKDKDQYSILTHIYGILKDGNDNPICRTEKETQMYRTNFWTLWEKARVGWSERIALKHVYYQVWNRSPD